MVSAESEADYLAEDLGALPHGSKARQDQLGGAVAFGNLNWGSSAALWLMTSM